MLGRQVQVAILSGPDDLESVAAGEAERCRIAVLHRRTGHGEAAVASERDRDVRERGSDTPATSLRHDRDVEEGDAGLERCRTPPDRARADIDAIERGEPLAVLDHEGHLRAEAGRRVLAHVHDVVDGDPALERGVIGYIDQGDLERSGDGHRPSVQRLERASSHVEVGAGQAVTETPRARLRGPSGRGAVW